MRCSDRSKPLEQGWQGNGLELDLGARIREQTGKGKFRCGWLGSGDGGATGELRSERVVGAEDKGVGG